MVLPFECFEHLSIKDGVTTVQISITEFIETVYLSSKDLNCFWFYVFFFIKEKVQVCFVSICYECIVDKCIQFL